MSPSQGGRAFAANGAFGRSGFADRSRQFNEFGHHRDFDDFRHRDFDDFRHHRNFVFPVTVWPYWFPSWYASGYSPYGVYGYPYSGGYYSPYATYGYGYGTDYPATIYNYNVYPDTYSTAVTPSDAVASGYVSGGESTVAAGSYYALAVDAFRRGDYAEAVRQANHAAVDSPRDPRVPELLSLALFAQGDYSNAALAAHAALTLGPAADWATLYRYYGDLPTYTRQLDALVRYVNANPNAPDGRFLLGYHDLMMGHADAARTQFAEAARLAPQDALAQKLAGTAATSNPTAPAP